MESLTVGSDCSGMSTELHALDLLNIKYIHEFSSEIWEPAIRYIRSNHRPKKLWRDMSQRNMDDVPYVDLYVCGFPCQPVSGMNQNKKEDDPRREILNVVLDYIETKKPKYFILENVVGLMRASKGAIWNKLVDRLDGMKDYTWDYRILDPCKHAGSPQSRPRIYICGRKGNLRFNWPSEIPLQTSCVDILDHNAEEKTAAPCYHRQMRTWGITSSDVGIIEFCAASRQFSPYIDSKILNEKQRAQVVRSHIAACLIRHDPGPYAVHLDRMLTANECLVLQGFDTSKVRKPQVTPLQMRQLCGNAMHCGVLTRLLQSLLSNSV